jgi:hypothetical protein
MPRLIQDHSFTIRGNMRPWTLVRRSLPAALAILGALTAPASAQSLCWKRRPLTECKTWVVSEAGFEKSVGQTSIGHKLTYPRNDFMSRLTLSLGLMSNRGTDHALGLTASLAAEDDRYGFGTTRLETRYRKWYSHGAAVDLSAGLSRKAIDDSLWHRANAAGITTAVGISNTYLGIDARVDLLRGDGRFLHGASVGVRAGSQMALPAGALVLVGFVVGRFLNGTLGWYFAGFDSPT